MEELNTEVSFSSAILDLEKSFDFGRKEALCDACVAGCVLRTKRHPLPPQVVFCARVLPFNFHFLHDSPLFIG
jgi:hypothetical protein